MQEPLKFDLSLLGEKLTPPAFAPDEVRVLIKRQYGIDGQLKALEGERDQNFRISDGGPQRWVVKISGDTETQSRVDYYVQTLLHLEKMAPQLPLPRGVKSKSGDLYFVHQFENGMSQIVRLVTYLEGKPVLSREQSNRDWIFHLGAFQGAICRALTGFSHPGCYESMPWNSSSNLIFEPALMRLLEPDFTTLLEQHMDRLQAVSQPALQNIRPQIIHNDAHTGNILTDDLGQITGVIDFGDSICAPVIQDLAVSATSIAEMFPSEACALIVELKRGFCSELPLLPEEHEILYDAILLRSMLCVALGQLKDTAVPRAARPRPTSLASQTGLRTILSLENNAFSATTSMQRITNG